MWFLEASEHKGSLGKLPGIWKVVFVDPRRLLGKDVRILLAERAKTKSFAFLNDIAPSGEPFMLDRLFHIIFKEICGYKYNDWSMII